MPENDVSVVPANEAAWEDLQTVFGRGAAAKCQCQRIKLGDGAKPSHNFKAALEEFLGA